MNIPVQSKHYAALQYLCLLLAALAWRFICCTEPITEAITEAVTEALTEAVTEALTEAVTEAITEEPVETNVGKPESTETEPLAVAKEPSPTENGSIQTECGALEMKETEADSFAVKEESSSSPPPTGK